MTSSTDSLADAAAVRRRVAHDLYQRLALASAVIWTLGTFLLFVVLAAGHPRPIPMAALSMLLPLFPAVFIWTLYRPLVAYLTARELRVADRTD